MTLDDHLASNNDMSESPAANAEALSSEVEKTKSFGAANKHPMQGMTAALDALQNQTMQIALLGNVGTTQEISELRDQMRNQDQKHKEALTEIQSILDDLLQTQIQDSMRQKVEEEITAQIDDMVKEYVAECLKAHIPQDLQEEVAMSKKELEELNLRLHNSESRRANGKLRSNKPNDLLATMYMLDGQVSSNYPKDLKGLFTLRLDKIKTLMTEYGLPNITESRESNLNRLMQFCGVRYQLVE
ncbi:hypothetical protein D9619_001639 [Psilocybe cf. subviscida]|uniref:Uncharacterized protein n=1 Tax=Psilocybe cf. subviscida TaxID=2480587 RepID=A0A8H5BFD6_9AGAR|nr:hypothetical protein D9619_001639 [Psilocybe cf. subviscida]